MSKALDILSATARVDQNLLKDLAIQSVDQEDLKTYWKSEKSHISLGDRQSYYLQVFQRL